MGGKCNNTYRIQLWCLALLILVLESQGRCSLNSEGLALLEFRAGVDSDPYGAFANWNPNDCDPCLWSGVQCVDGQVQMLDLNGLSLEGVLAPELGQLSHLRTLILSENQFSGTIPKEFDGLTKLEVLDLRNNNFSGTIPAEVGDMQSLKRLLLCNNKFEGSFPSELEKLNYLFELQFDENISSGVTGIGCLNRKLGHCIWQNGSKPLKKSESIMVPIKVTIARYLNLLPLSVEDCIEPLKKADSIIIPIKGTLSRYLTRCPLFKFGKGSMDGHADDWSSNIPSLPESDPQIDQDVLNGVKIVRRRLYQRWGSLAQQTTNVLAPPASSGGALDDQIIALPSSRSSGSYPAVKGPMQAPTPAPTTTNVPAQGTRNTSNSAQPAGGSDDTWKYVVGFSVGSFLLLSLVVVFFVCRSKAARNIAPWKTGLSGQLQKAFVTGVPKLNRTELETACEDFSNIIDTQDGCIMYKGTLSSGVEIAVISTTIPSIKDWSKRAEKAFQKKIDTLSRVNHKNFVNLIGYCEEDEPYVRMMVFEYAPNGSLFEHLHVKDVEQIDWNARMRIIMGTAYCLQYMHGLNPPVHHSNLNSNSIYLTDDFAAKIIENSFWKELSRKGKISGESESEHSETQSLAGSETDIYNFAILCLEIISGKLPYSEEQGPLLNWAKEYINDKRNFGCMIDPSLKSFKNEELEIVCEVIQECIQAEGRKRPNMTEIITKLRGVIDISPEHAVPRLSPLWWAELEILSAEAP